MALATIKLGKQSAFRGRGVFWPAMILALLAVGSPVSASAASRQNGPLGPPPSLHAPARPAPPLDARAVADHIEHVRRARANLKTPDSDCRALAEESDKYLGRATQALERNERFLADRFAAASDAFVQAVNHSQGIEDGPPSPPHPALNSSAVADHLQHVYFHLQQVDYFERVSGEPDAKQLPQIARDLYEQALRAYDTRDWPRADDFARATDDTIAGLENLAQAATPLPPPRIRPPE